MRTVTVRCPEDCAYVFRELGFRPLVCAIENGVRYVVLVLVDA